MARRPFDLSEEIMKCVRCGQCRSVCPIFLETGLERHTPRGRIILTKALLERTLTPDKYLADALNNCLLCHSCVVECPNGVNAPEIILYGRAELVRRRGLSLVKKTIFRVLYHPRLYRWLGRVGAALLPIIGRAVTAGAGKEQVIVLPSAAVNGNRVKGFQVRWSLPGLAKGRLLPPVRPRSFMADLKRREPGLAADKATVEKDLLVEQAFSRGQARTQEEASPHEPALSRQRTRPQAEVLLRQPALFRQRARQQEEVLPREWDQSQEKVLPQGAIPKARPKVAFFVGCAIDQAYPEIGWATLEVLEKNGIEVVVPESQVCCGIPALAAGDLEAARTAMVKNLEALGKEDYSAVITACATCGSTLRVEYPGVLSEGRPELRERARVLAERVRDISEFLAELSGFTRPTGSLAARVTYHDPCHLKKVQGVKDEPRALLAAIPELQLVEMKNADACCGCGGSYSLAYYHISRRINERKWKGVEETGAQVLATSCPGCLLHLRDGAERRGSKVEVVHVVELLAAAYGDDRQPDAQGS